MAESAQTHAMVSSNTLTLVQFAIVKLQYHTLQIEKTMQTPAERIALPH